MGNVLKLRRKLPRPVGALAWLPLVALLLWGCASATQSRSVRATTAPPEEEAKTESASATTPSREIATVELREGAPATYLEVQADGSLVWTSYRDSDGNLVIELPNSRPGSEVMNLLPEEGLVASVTVETEEIAGRPLTRLTVATREEASHSLEAEGERLRLELMPVAEVAGETQLAEAEESDLSAPAYTAYEPLPPGEPEGEVALEEVQVSAQAPPTAASPEAEAASSVSPSSLSGEPVSGPPATVLRGVEIASTLEGSVVRILGDGQFTYTTIQLSDPARFVLDLSGVVNASSRSTVPVGGEILSRVRIAQFKPFPDPVSRVVFDLTEAETAAIEPIEGGLLVRFGAAAEQAAAMEPAPLPEEPSPDAYDAGEESVAVADTVADSGVASESESEIAPPSSAPVAPEAAGTQPGTQMAQMEVEEGATEEGWPAADAYEAQVDDDAYDAASEESTLAATEPQPPLVPAPSSEEPGRVPPPLAEEPMATSDVAMFEAAEVEYTEPEEERETLATTITPQVVGGAGQVWSGDPISLSLKDADIKDVLRSFSTITGLNVVVHPGVRGSVTVELNEVPWDQALDLILRINGLDYVLEGNIMRIASTRQLEEEAQARRALAAAQADEIPLQTVIRSISYANATSIARLLTTSQGIGRGQSRGGILSSRGSITVDDRTNKLIIKELPANMQTVLAIIQNLDTAEPQVLIEARIVETTKQYSRSLGIQWSFSGVADEQFGNTTGLVFPHRGTVDGGVQLLTGGQNGFLDINLGNILNTFQLDLQLQAAETEGLVSILSAPKIATLNNQQASIQSGLQIPIQTVSNNTVSVQFVNATLSLDVTPQVTAEGTVLLDINIAKRAPQPGLAVAGSTNAPISTKQARTRVIVRDGGTTVIGGIYEVTSDRGEDRVPGLASVPILGHLFKNRRRTNNNEELLIFLTPRVIQL